MSDTIRPGLTIPRVTNYKVRKYRPRAILLVCKAGCGGTTYNRGGVCTRCLNGELPRSK